MSANLFARIDGRPGLTLIPPEVSAVSMEAVHAYALQHGADEETRREPPLRRRRITPPDAQPRGPGPARHHGLTVVPAVARSRGIITGMRCEEASRLQDIMRMETLIAQW